MSNGKAKAEEEDLDDLDDVLEQFTNPQPAPPTKPASVAPSSTAPAAPAKSVPTEPDEDALNEEFAKHLATEMEAMMRKLSDEMSAAPSASGPAPSTDTTSQDAAFRETWNKMLAHDLETNGKGNGLDTFLGRGDDPSDDADLAEEGSKQNAKAQSTPDDNDPFQKAIRQAMEKLQESDDTLKADSRGGQDTLENLLSSLGDLNLGDNGTEGGENLESMLETMMSQLMSKEILYEPLKELDTKYPEYLSKNSSTLSPEDLSRYADQKIRVSQIVALFENPSYSDDNAAQSAEVLRLMNEMQSYGSPPSEIMGAMPPGFDLGADGLPNVPEGCIIA